MSFVKLSTNIKKIIKNKILEILTKIEVNGREEILTKTRLSRTKNGNKKANNTRIDKLAVDLSPIELV